MAQFRKMLKRDPVTAALIIPSARFERCLDLNGDGKADFAFIDSKCDFTGNGSIDTFGIDIGKGGEFCKEAMQNYVNSILAELAKLA